MTNNTNPQSDLTDASTPLACDDCGTVRCAPYGQPCKSVTIV